MTSPTFESAEHRQITPAVQWLIVLNVGLYFLQKVLLGDLSSPLALDSSHFSEKWWTLGTYMFVHFANGHEGIGHIGLNMLTLWMFGPRVEEGWSTRGFVYFYLWCGLGGAIFHLLLVRTGLLIGASAAIMGVMLAYATRWPDEDVYLFGVVPMRARWLVVWLVVINLGMGIMEQAGGNIGWFAHLGGLVFGWLYLHGPSSEGLERLRHGVAAAPDEGEGPPHPIPRTLPRRRSQPVGIDEIIAESNAEAERHSSSTGTTMKHPVLPSVMHGLSPERAAEMNAVLDKISRHGLGSLSRDERRLLEELSRRLRDG